MNTGKYIFSQIIDFIIKYEFDKCVDRYQGNKKIRSLSCRDQFQAMVFGQLGNLKSLSGIVVCLNAHQKQLFHLGFRSKKFTLSTLTRANENRDWRIYGDFANLLIDKTKWLYIHDNNLDIKLTGNAYAIDSSVIELCFSIFKWAKFCKGYSGVKLHMQINIKTNIPSFFLITRAVTPDWDFLDDIDYEKGAYYIMDRGYYCFTRLYRIHLESAYFITRSKKNFSFKRIYSRSVDKSNGIRCDQIIKLDDYKSRKKYPDKLRRIKYYDQETDHCYVYLTNNFELKANIIADLYKNRWQIELFFKWIKQHLHINS